MQHHNLLLGHNHMDFMQTKCDIQDRTHQNNWHIWWTFSYFSNSNWIGDNYIRHSGFLPLADANDVILLFPQVSPHFYSTLAFPGSGLERRSRWSYNPPPCQIHPLNSAGNANGCWDWWVSNQNYIYLPKIKAVVLMSGGKKWYLNISKNARLPSKESGNLNMIGENIQVGIPWRHRRICLW